MKTVTGLEGVYDWFRVTGSSLEVCLCTAHVGSAVDGDRLALGAGVGVLCTPLIDLRSGKGFITSTRPVHPAAQLTCLHPCRTGAGKMDFRIGGTLEGSTAFGAPWTSLNLFFMIHHASLDPNIGRRTCSQLQAI